MSMTDCLDLIVVNIRSMNVDVSGVTCVAS